MKTHGLIFIGYRALTAQKNVTELTHGQADHKRRCRHEGRAVQNLTQRLSQVAISNRIGRTEIKSSAGLLLLKNKEDGRHKIIQMQPRKPLIAISEGTADKHFKNRYQFGHGTAVFPKDNPESHDGNPAPFGACPQRFLFPIYRNTCQKITAGPFIFF